MDGPTETDPAKARHARMAAARHHGETHPILDLRKPFGATVPDSSVGAVHRVARLDGRTRIVAGRVPGGAWWRLHRRLRLTHEHARELQAAGVSEVVLRRGLRGASFPLAWLVNRHR